jgi:hypothetical protein
MGSKKNLIRTRKRRQARMNQEIQSIARHPMKFGSTTLFVDSMAAMIGFQILEDEYEDNGAGTLERETPQAILFFPGVEIVLEGEDFEAFKQWLEKSTRSVPQIKLAEPAAIP